jgi:hypothetical protein
MGEVKWNCNPIMQHNYLAGCIVPKTSVVFQFDHVYPNFPQSSSNNPIIIPKNDVHIKTTNGDMSSFLDQRMLQQSKRMSIYRKESSTIMQFDLPD